MSLTNICFPFAYYLADWYGRFVGWVNEENGARGGAEYARAHASELAKHAAVIETDLGAFHAIGYVFHLGASVEGGKREERTA